MTGSKPVFLRPTHYFTESTSAISRYLRSLAKAISRSRYQKIRPLADFMSG